MEPIVEEVLAALTRVQSKRLPRTIVLYKDIPRKHPISLPDLMDALAAELPKHSSRFVIDLIRREPVEFDVELPALFTLGSIGLLAPVFIALYAHHRITKPTLLILRFRVLRPAADPIPGTPDRNGVRARRYTV